MSTLIRYFLDTVRLSFNEHTMFFQFFQTRFENISYIAIHCQIKRYSRSLNTNKPFTSFFTFRYLYFFCFNVLTTQSAYEGAQNRIIYIIIIHIYYFYNNSAEWLDSLLSQL